MMLKDFSTDAINNGAELELRVTQNVRIPCPSCSQELNIRPRHVGKMGECRYCGHRFQARVRCDPAPARGLALRPHLRGLQQAPKDNPAGNLGRVVQSLEEELQQTWAQLTARQASVLGRLIAELGVQPGALPPPDQGEPEASAPSHSPETFEDDPAPAPDDEPAPASDDEHERFLDATDEPSATDPAASSPLGHPVGGGWPDEAFRAARSYAVPSAPFALNCPVAVTGLGFEAVADSP